MPKKTPAASPRSKSQPSTPNRGRGAPPPSSLTRRSAGAGKPTGPLPEQQRGFDELAAAVPFNTLKASEYSASEAAVEPQAGEPIDPPNALVGASTVTEGQAGEKVGAGASEGLNPSNASLDRVRVDSTGQRLTTNQGVPVADNQSSLKAGLRGPTLLEDFILREKITHFDHERIPERVVHARGSAAHGFFECTKALGELTRAVPFASAGKQTPVFVRFSTVAGERGSVDTARDVRGFAVKFYTEEGNWDLVGNNIPVFFIQDAMKFPDLIHSVKPEPHNAMPQAASAHDTFWDFVSLTPESTHMLLWQMSDRTIPRSYRMMQGFGVHTFRLVNAAGESVFCKFHFNPVAGTHALLWDEAVKIAGADSDFHRRDLWDAIESGAFPEWEVGLQIFTEEQAEAFSFDVLDSTKLVPEDLVPVEVVGKLVLNRNPDNFFAETEQVAFCTAHVVPGIDFSDDPLLQGRHHSYLDTQITRLGGANFHELPINAALAPVHNNQRDGIHRQAIPRGRVSYEPNSLGGGCPFQAGAAGFQTFAAPVGPTKVRGKSERFGEHFAQATLFWKSQSEAEQRHIISAFRFELSKVKTQAIRERVVSLLGNVDEALCRGVAEGLGMKAIPEPMPRVAAAPDSEVEVSKALSLLARPGDGSVKAKKVALLVAPGVETSSLIAARKALEEAGAVPCFVGARLGEVQGANGVVLEVEATFENAPSVLFDAAVLPGGEGEAQLQKLDGAQEFVRLAYRHCKPLLVLGSGELLPSEGRQAEADPALCRGTGSKPLAAFLGALGRPRSYDREALA